MLTEKDYCDKDTAFALQELGYYPYMYYDDGTPVFFLWYAQKWLREEKHLHIEVRWYSNMWYEYEVKETEGKILAEGTAFKTYEEALRTAVYMATEHLKAE